MVTGLLSFGLNRIKFERFLKSDGNTLTLSPTKFYSIIVKRTPCSIAGGAENHELHLHI